MGLKKTLELSYQENFYFGRKMSLKLSQILTKKTCRAECLLHPSLILEKDVDHPSLQRFSPDG